MTTVEKLLVQFCERKQSIIDLVKQQTESYSQHLACEFLIDGITPPSWLWDPNSSSSKELSKDDLISKILRPYPRPSVWSSVAHYPGYSDLVITGDNKEFGGGDFVENLSFNKDLDRKNDLTAPGFSDLDHGESGFNQMPELDAAVASPEDQINGRTFSIYTAPDRSLAGIQRSKSRQKALELRSSAKAVAKSGLRHESINDVVSSQIRFSLSITNQPGQTDELSQLAEPCVVSSQSCEDRNVKAHCSSREMGVDSYSESLIRSGSYAEFPLGCSSENCKENASSQVALPKRTETMPILSSEHADNHYNTSPESAGPSAVCCQSLQDKIVQDADFLCKNEQSNVYTGESTMPGVPSKRQSCGCDSTKADRSSDDYHGIDITMVESRDQPLDCVDGFLVKVNVSSSWNEVCDARKSVLEDFGRHKERETFPSSSSIQHKERETFPSSSSIQHKERDTFPSSSSIQCNACIDEISNLEVSSVSVKTHGGILALSTAGSAGQVNDSEELLGLVKPSVGLFRRLTRSQTRSYDEEMYHPATVNENCSLKGTNSISDHEEKFAEELQTTSSCQSVPPCLGTHNMLHDDNNGKLFLSNGRALFDHAAHSCLSNSNYSRQIRGLVCAVAASVERKQLHVIETEGYNLKAFTSRSGNKSLDNLPQKMSCNLHASDMSLVKGICGGNNQPSASKLLVGMLDVSSEEEKAHRDSFEPDVLEDFGPILGSTILNDFKDSTEAELNCSSEVQDAAETLLSKMVDRTGSIQVPPVKLHVKHGLESSPVQCMDQGHCRDKGRDKGKLVSSVPKRKNSMLSDVHSSAEEPVVQSYGCLTKKAGMNPVAINEIKQYTTRQSQILSWPEGEVFGEQGDSSLRSKFLARPSKVRLQGKNSSLERISTHMRNESWPQAKRRKIELEPAHSLTTSQCFRVTNPHSFQRDAGNMYLKTIKTDVESGHMEHLNMIVDDGTCLEVNTDQMEQQSAILSQLGEVGSHYIEKNEHGNTLPVTNNQQLVATISSLSMREPSNSLRCFIKETRTSPSSCNYLHARTSRDNQCIQNFCNLGNDSDNLNSEKLDLSSSTLHKETQQFPEWEDGSNLQHSVLSLSNEDLQHTDVDQSMPVLGTDELDFAVDGFDLCEPELPKTTLERVSILTEICRSASLDRPFSHFSSAFKFLEAWDLCKSVSDDVHLEHMEFGNIYPLNPDVGTHLQSHRISSDDYKDALDRMPYSVPLAYSGKRYGWNSKNQPLSPVGKLWGQLSSHTGSSGKCSNSNPELTCFPIEEDPSSSEDNKIMEDNAGDTQDEIESSLADHSDKRQPLKDMSNMRKNPPMSDSTEEETLKSDSVDLLSLKLSVSRTQDKALLGTKYQLRKKSETREKQTSLIGTADGRKHKLSSIGPNAIKKAKQSVNNSTRKSMSKKISKPMVSNKTSLKEQDQKLSLKESRQNNIVSNVSSFIPLVQQKQAATECTGKRDVKVKALEAAEAAKRLEERKENERKMRKEALKRERARLEEKNLRDNELEKKKKDEEQKKKDADIIARKRLREEEERKEKEKKRIRVEARQRHREQEEKKHAVRPEKENQRTKDAQLNNKKEFNNEPKRQQNKETAKGEGMTLQKTKTNLTLAVVNYEECGTSGLSYEAGEAMNAVDKSPRKEDLLVQTSEGKSYEISPYQCSEDEDEEDDDLPTKKYIPSWASKSSMALFLPLHQKLDPDVIFPRDWFCSLDAVWRPCKQQQKQAAM